MRSHAPAVVLGGGVVGCSILHHLAKAGWTEAVLLERSELTSGSNWHGAANIHGLHDVTNISRLQHYTMRLYKELEAETGQSCSVFQPGSLYLAQTEAREHQLRIQAAKARRYGMDFYEVGRGEAERLHPLVDFDGIRCIMYEPDGGNVDPSGVKRLCGRGAPARRGDPPLHARDRHRCAGRRHLDRSHRQGRHPDAVGGQRGRSTQMAGVCGPNGMIVLALGRRIDKPPARMERLLPCPGLPICAATNASTA